MPIFVEVGRPPEPELWLVGALSSLGRLVGDGVGVGGGSVRMSVTSGAWGEVVIVVLLFANRGRRCGCRVVGCAGGGLFRRWMPATWSACRAARSTFCALSSPDACAIEFQEASSAIETRSMNRWIIFVFCRSTRPMIQTCIIRQGRCADHRKSLQQTGNPSYFYYLAHVYDSLPPLLCCTVRFSP